MTKEKAIEMGGKEWKKDGKHRVYFNSLESRAKLYGIELTFYKSGSIKSALRGGESMSNSKAYKILSSVTTPYYDVVTDEMIGVNEEYLV